MEHGSPRKFPRSSWPGSRVIKAALLAAPMSVDSLSSARGGKTGRMATEGSPGKYEKIMFEQPAKYLTENVLAGKRCCWRTKYVRVAPGWHLVWMAAI